MDYNETQAPISIQPLSDQHQFIPPTKPINVVRSLTSNQVADWGLTAIGAPYAWRYSKGQGVKVAVLDTGMQHHPDLLDCRGHIRSRFSVDPLCSPDDTVGHGTHCAGIVGASDNGIGVVGVAPSCELISIKVLGDDGSGSYDSILAGIRMAILKKCHIISMSLGCSAPPPSNKLQEAIHEAAMLGTVIVAAAGNSGDDVVDYPARLKLVIPVAAVDQKLSHADFSSTGDAMEHGISMPGVNIYSTYLDEKYATLSGTSMATPMLAGFIALMLSYHSKGHHQTPIRPYGDSGRLKDVWEHLKRYVKPLGNNRMFGIGTIDGSKLGKDED